MSNIQSLLRSQAERKTHNGKPWTEWHSPLRLVAALISEIGELAHHIRFARYVTPGAPEIEDEIADIGIFWFRLADVLGVDALEAVKRKMQANERR